MRPDSKEREIDDAVVERTRRPFAVMESDMNRIISKAVAVDIDADAVIDVLDPIWLTVNPIMKEIRP